MNSTLLIDLIVVLFFLEYSPDHMCTNKELGYFLVEYNKPARK